MLSRLKEPGALAITLAAGGILMVTMGARQSVGTGVMGGMISATILAIYFVPLFFVLVRRRFPLKERPE